MAEAVGAEKGERIEGRLSSRSGYYTRGLVTRVGKLKLRVPQDRKWTVLDRDLRARYRRREKALVAAFTQMSIQRVSIRKAQAISEELCGHSLARARSVRSIKSSMPNWDASRGGNSKASIPI